MAILSESSRLSRNAEVTIYKLMNDQADANTTSDVIDVLDAEAVSLIVESSAGTASGAVTLEGAATSTYAGTWAALDSITTSAASTAYAKTVGLADNAASLPIPYVRARISTVIGSGTVDVYLVVRK